MDLLGTLAQARMLQSVMTYTTPAKRVKSKYGKQTFAVSHLLQGTLVPKRVFSRLDDECQTGSDGFSRFCLLGFFGCHWKMVVVDGEEGMFVSNSAAIQ